MRIFLPVTLIFCCFNGFAQTPISGSIGGMTFKPSGNPWLVSGNVFVEAESKTIVEPGCVFLFKPYTGIVIEGSFIVEGEKDKPVVFTSINDSLYSETAAKKPEPFDWNGIIIENEAVEVSLSHFKLSYSVYGIKSKVSSLSIKDGIFRQNGQFHFTINEKIQDVESNLPFDYNSQDVPEKSDKEKSQKKALAKRAWVKPVGIGSISIGTVLLGTMGYFIYSSADFDRKYNNTDDYDESQHYLTKRDDAVKNAIVTGIIGGVFISTGTGLLLWEHSTKGGKKKTVTAYPVIGKANGVQVVVKF